MITMLPENKGELKWLNYCVTKDPGEKKLRLGKILYIRIFLIEINIRGGKAEKEETEKEQRAPERATAARWTLENIRWLEKKTFSFHKLLVQERLPPISDLQISTSWKTGGEREASFSLHEPSHLHNCRRAANGSATHIHSLWAVIAEVAAKTRAFNSAQVFYESVYSWDYLEN